MNNYYSLIKYTLIPLALLGFTGCKMTAQVPVGDGTMTVIYEQDQGNNNLVDQLLSPFQSLMASAAVITQQEWSDFDPAKYYLILDNTNSASLARNITITLYQDGSQLASNSFPSNRVGNEVHFNQPSQVKSWLANYKDTSDEMRVDVDLQTDYFGSGSVTTNYKYEGNSLAAATYNHTCHDGENPIFVP
ncbi:hypothetical protein P4S73_02700 [Paraglaciecola sp. Hal342]